MTKHVEIAEAFVREQLLARDDIVGALLVGSAAGGEVSGFSDIDLRLISAGKEGEAISRDGLDRWQDGLYIDATLVAQEDYFDVEQILASRSAADDMQFGLILFDADGWLAERQRETQALYMQPEWIGKRIEPLLNMVPERLALLAGAIKNHDPLHILIHAGRVFAGLAYLPLLSSGLQASSTRNMVQLSAALPALALKLCRVEGSTSMHEETIRAALAAFVGLTDLDASHDYQTLSGYMLGKAEWMAGNGYPLAAVHMGWLHSSNRAIGCEACGDEMVFARAGEFAQDWLQAVGWVYQDCLVAKQTTMVEIWEEVRVIVAGA